MLNFLNKLGFSKKKQVNAQHLKLGQAGEELAAKQLKKLGYQILERNWRKNQYEIDIIAKDQDVLVFVEVRTRKAGAIQSPEQSFIGKKHKQIQKASEYYRLLNNYQGAYRLDFVAVEELPEGKLQAEIYNIDSL